MEQKQKLFIRMTGWGFRFVAVVIVGVVLLGQGMEYVYKTDLPWSNILCALVGLAGAALFFLLARVFSGHVKKKSSRYLCMGAFSLLAACLTFYASAHYAMTPQWDVGMMCANAMSLANGEVSDLYQDYFSQYNNNILLTWLLAMSYRLGRLLGVPSAQEYFVGLALQSLGFGMAAFLVYVCLDKLVGEDHPAVPLWAWFMMLILVCASPWVVVMYSDSASVPLVMIQVWLFLQARERGKFRPLWAGLLALTAVFALHIKPQGFFVSIAAVLMTLFTEAKSFLRKENLKKTGALLLAFLAGAGLAEGGYRAVISGCNLELNPHVSLGPTHFFMMGQNVESSGTYAAEDVDFSMNTPLEERSAANLQEAFRRFGEMGLGGWLEHAAKKTMISFGDGTFTWEKEGNFYVFDTYYFPLCTRWGYDNIPSFYIGEEYWEMVDWSCSHIFRTMEQCAWIAVLILGIFAYSRRTGAGAAALLLTVIGIMVFQLFFECRARYIFCLSPVFVMVAGLGLAHITEELRRPSWPIRYKRRKKTENEG